MSPPRCIPLLLALVAAACTSLPEPAPGGGKTEAPIDLAALRASPRFAACPAFEVSPGNWVRFECGPRRSLVRHAALLPPLLRDSAALPDTVDHRAEGWEGPMRSQGVNGSCSALSLASAMDHALRRAAVADSVAAIHLWSRYGQPSLDDAYAYNVGLAAASEAVWPYRSSEACKLSREVGDECGAAYGVTPATPDDPALVAKRQHSDAQGRYLLQSAGRLPSHASDGLAAYLAAGEDIWASLATERHAWTHGMVDNVVADYDGTDAWHVLVLSGYRNAGGERQFLIHNSWGDDWGEAGYAWIRASTLAKHMDAAYVLRVAVVPPGTSAPPPGTAPPTTPPTTAPPGTPPAAPPLVPPPGGPPLGPPPGCLFPFPPVSDQCPTGQLVDPVTQKCAPMCPSCLPPVGGACIHPDELGGGSDSGCDRPAHVQRCQRVCWKERYFCEDDCGYGDDSESCKRTCRAAERPCEDECERTCGESR